jgi:hypothetical protein
MWNVKPGGPSIGFQTFIGSSLYTQLNNHPHVTPAKIAPNNETNSAAISIFPIFIIHLQRIILLQNKTPCNDK